MTLSRGPEGGTKRRAARESFVQALRDIGADEVVIAAAMGYRRRMKLLLQDEGRYRSRWLRKRG